MGEVHAAEDLRLHRVVALKVLPRETALDPERLQRFEREARAVAALNHPNVVTLYGVEEASGLHSLSSDIRRGADHGPDTGWFNPAGAPRPADLPITYEIARLRELVDLLI